MNPEQMNNVQAQKLPDDIKKAPIMISLIIGVFFAILNETLLNVAYTDLMTDLKVTESTVQWLATGFMLVVGILVPVSALLVQWFTTRQMFLGAMFLFTIGTLICGMAPNFGMLLVGRLIQAAGTGLLIPVMMNTILVLFPPEKRGAAMGSIGLVIMFAPAIGPTLSGLILEVMHWRWLFYIVVPFAVFSIAFAWVYLKNVTEVTKPRVDVWSILLSTVGFGGVVYGFSSVGEHGGSWSVPEVYLPVSVGIVSLMALIWRQLVMEEPMLDLRAFKSPTFSLTVVVMIIMMMSLFATMIILPLFMRGALMMTAFTAGLVLLPGGLLNGALSPVMGKLFDKFGPRPLLIPGAVILIGVLWLFTRISPETSTLTVIVLHSLLMVAIATIMMPAQTNGLNELTPKYYPHGTAILNTLQQIAGAIGVALFISIMSSAQRDYLSGVNNPEDPAQLMQALTEGVQTAFMVGTGFAVVGLVVILFIKRAAPAASEEKKAEAA